MQIRVAHFSGRSSDYVLSLSGGMFLPIQHIKNKKSKKKFFPQNFFPEYILKIQFSYCNFSAHTRTLVLNYIFRKSSSSRSLWYPYLFSDRSVTKVMASLPQVFWPKYRKFRKFQAFSWISRADKNTFRKSHRGGWVLKILSRMSSFR